MTDQDDLDHQRQPGRDRAAALLESLAAPHVDTPLSLEATRWVRQAARERYRGTTTSFDEGLGLAGQGNRTIEKARRIERDRLLRIAAELLKPGGRHWSQAGELEARIQRRHEPGRRLDDPGLLIQAADRLAGPVPATRGSLYDILRGATTATSARCRE